MMNWLEMPGAYGSTRGLQFGMLLFAEIALRFIAQASLYPSDGTSTSYVGLKSDVEISILASLADSARKRRVDFNMQYAPTHFKAHLLRCDRTILRYFRVHNDLVRRVQ